MSERPFMQLYVSDFVGDTLLLSAEHIGVYLLLLIALWNAHGELPKNEVKLARAARLTVENWRVVWSEIEQFFEVSETSISHGRLSRELLKARGKSVSRSEAGRKGGNAKALKDKNIGLSNAMPLPRHLPKPYKKDGAIASDPTKELARVDKHIEPELWAVLSALPDQPNPPRSWEDHHSWPKSLVAEHRALIAKKAAA